MSKRFNTWFIPAVFFCICLLKILLFTLHNWDLPDEGLLSYFLLKISAALAICCVAFFFKNKIWTVVFSFVFDFWIVANQVYLRSNHLCFDGYSSTLVKNLKGFGGGVFGLFEWFDLTYVVLSVALCVVVSLMGKASAKNGKIGLYVAFASLLTGFFGMLSFNGLTEERNKCFNPFSYKMHEVVISINDYCNSVSIAHLFIYDMYDFARILTGMTVDIDVSLSDNDKILTSKISHPELVSSRFQFTDTVVVLLIESLENWAIHPEIMPNTVQFLEREHIFYAGKVRPQIAAGTSSDGQFLVNSGLTPIDRGAICFTFPKQKYPSIAKNAAGEAITLIPHSDVVWNQKEMSFAEGYGTTRQITEEDDVVFNSTIAAVKEGYQVVQALTMSSHVPFSFGERRSHLWTPFLMPSLMSAYLKCMNYTDENLAIIYEATKEGGPLHNATIVITGDHTIFYKDKRSYFERYCRKNNLGYAVEEEVCPLIIYSPHISGNIRYEEICWQMDIYPTVMALLGNPDPTWKGLGMDLIGEKERTVPADEVMRLGNKLIRNDFFSDLP